MGSNVLESSVDLEYVVSAASIIFVTMTNNNDNILIHMHLTAVYQEILVDSQLIWPIQQSGAASGAAAFATIIW
jgi:hypothetical protein